MSNGPSIVVNTLIACDKRFMIEELSFVFVKDFKRKIITMETREVIDLMD